MARQKKVIQESLRCKDDPNYRRFRDTDYYISLLGDIKKDKGDFDKPISTYKKKTSTIFSVVQGRYSYEITVGKAVYEAFRGTIPDGYVIVHKNGIKTDNRLENLVLMSKSEFSVLRNKQSSKAVYCYETKRLYKNADECARALGYSRKNIYKMLCNCYGHTTAYRLRYMSEDDMHKLRFI